MYSQYQDTNVGRERVYLMILPKAGKGETIVSAEKDLQLRFVFTSIDGGWWATQQVHFQSYGLVRDNSMWQV